MSFSEWNEYSFQDITINHDKSRKPLSSKEREKMQGKYPYYGAQGIIDNINNFIFDGTYMLIAEDGENLKSKKQNIAQLAHGQFWVNNHAHIVTNNHLSDIRYLCYLFNNTDVSGYITGSAQPKLSQSNLNSIKVKIPTLIEQKTIADTLSCLDDKIDLNNRINKNFEEMAQAIFKSWFVDFEPFQEGGFEDSELGRLPKGWKTVELSEIIQVKDGTHDSPKQKEKGYSLVTSKHLKPYEIDFKETYYIDENDYIKINQRSKVEKCDILISMIGTVGNLSYVLYDEINFAIKNIGLFKTSGKKEIAEFILLYLKSNEMKDYIISRLAGSTQKYISLTELRKIPILVPKDEIIATFKTIVQPLLNKIFLNTQETQNLTTIRDCLLQKLMSGEIRVPVAEVQ